MVSGWPATQTAQAAQSAPYAYSPNPAFIPVQIRQGFSQYIPAPRPNQAEPSAPPAMSPPAASPPETHSKAKTEWPDSVRRYVQRSFLPQNDDASVTRSELEAKLKETIGTAKENGSMHSLDWDKMPLPQVLVKADRAAKLGNPLYSVENTRKRKSTEFANEAVAKAPWNTVKDRNSLEIRTSPAYDKQGDMDNRTKSSKFQKDANKRKRRFENEYNAANITPTENIISSGPIVGTSEVLEKRYLRLTAPPIPSNVRPEHILRQTLDLLKKKWRKEGNYSYVCDQFKSMRQDLTVQRIRNDFTVSVYEIHARIALEKGDIGEYNQCQTQLRSLYELGLKGNPMEFKAYRILYFIHTANRTGLNDTLADLTAAEKEEPPIKHALSVRSALALGSYHKFFQLYLDTPNMGAYLMDMFVVRERLSALCNMCRAYKPDVKLRFITEELGFESDADAAQFIIDQQGQDLLEDRSDNIVFLTGKAGNLFEDSRATAFKRVDIKGQI
ncbi:SAC3/GANP domain protein [Cordyceps fumosorosea ARSEF 2679]|uniref:SAC3/GANP domain protein n=1 Tax=Cordyceps fumosorosea (strain ARSEF 2679) TaxID=1081104 RepID=A0A167TNX3_CORFA|nr:SAC3/GANP domain protein [Cordyceps fumosorosea ARSEF 2679]OAA60794.1 SAC3/GANP domain protein [Cordyceps fumosorosea ARSEF 2679]